MLLAERKYFVLLNIYTLPVNFFAKSNFHTKKSPLFQDINKMKYLPTNRIFLFYPSGLFVGYSHVASQPL